MGFIISQKEIARRKKANMVVTVSLTVGFFLGLFRLWSDFLWQTLVCTAGCFVSLWAIRIVSIRVLDRHLKTQINLDDTAVIRVTEAHEEKMNYDDIRQLRILKTTRGDVRQVKIIPSHGKMVVVNGLEHFQQFVDQLKSSATHAVVHESREPIDFDHPLFYYFLGPIVGFAVTCGVTSLYEANSIRIAVFVFAALIVGLGLYFLISQPLKKWYGA